MTTDDDTVVVLHVSLYLSYKIGFYSTGQADNDDSVFLLPICFVELYSNEACRVP